MKKQTAVQLLKESIDHELKSGTKMVVNWDMYLAMEKEQIEQAWRNGFSSNEGMASYYYNAKYRRTPEKYYNETYGDNK